MFGSRFFWKLFAGYVALVVLSAAIVGVMVASWAEESAQAETEKSLRQKGEFLRELALPRLTGDTDPAFQNRIQRLGKSLGTRLTVIREDGRVLADSDKAPGLMDAHNDRPEVREARDLPEGIGIATRQSRTLGQTMMYMALRVDEDGSRGFVRTAVPVVAVDARRADLRKSVLVGALISALVALALGFFVAYRVTMPLASMTRAARSIAAGDSGERVVVTSNDEVGDMADAFNAMAEQLEERMEMITKDRNELRAILAGMVEGVIAVDRREAIVQMNEVAGELLGVDRAACIGQPVWEVTRLPEIGDATRTALTEGKEVRLEAKVIREGGENTLELVASPLRAENGRAPGAVIMLHDVSELRRLEIVRRDFVANASHELKTPITAIRGMVETMAEDAAMPAETRKDFLRRMQRQSEQLSSLVLDLLTLSRLEAGREQDREAHDWRLAVQEVADSCRSLAEGKRIQFEVLCPSEQLSVLCDVETLRLVTSNLVDNAIKYTPEGGRVRLQLERDGEEGVLRVEDTGIGIAHDERDRVFERFYRVDKARSRELGGTGLGLSIVKHAVNALRGDVVVESEPGQGSVFTVRLPISRVTP